MKKILYLIITLCIIGCGGERNIHGIEVTELLLFSTETLDIDYCKILKNATKEDEKAIKQLLLLDIYGAAGYDHGAVIVGLIEFIGEDKIINIVEPMDYEQKASIMSYIEAGLLYGNNSNFNKQEICDAFPKLYVVLNCS